MDRFTERPLLVTDEVFAVRNYQSLIGTVRDQMAQSRMSVRDLARAAGRSLGVTSDALTGSCQPRWSTIESFAGAVRHRLALNDADVTYIELYFLLDDRITKCDWTYEEIAERVGVGPRTVYDFIRHKETHPKPDLSPATVLALAAFEHESIRLVPSTY